MEIPGQEPTPQPGQVPNTTPPALGGQAPQTFDAEYVRQLRDEAARYRTQHKEAADKLKAFEDGQLSEMEQAKKLAQEAADRATQAEQHLRSERAARLVEREARVLKIVDEEVALALIQAKLEFGTDGAPTNVKALLADLVKAKPYLVGTAEPGAPAPQPGSPGNPPRGQAPGAFTKEQVARMTPDQIASLSEKDYQAMLLAVSK